jgi:hypothetical protein
MVVKNWVNTPVPMDKTPSIRELVGKIFVIDRYEIKAGTEYVQAFIHTDLGVYRTSSDVIMKQLEKMKPDLEKGDTLRVSFEKPIGKKYYTFVAPKE